MRLLLLVLLIVCVPIAQSMGQLNTQVYNASGCGLNYKVYSAKITSRYASPPGTGLPVTFNVADLPISCYNIEKAYVWWTISGTNKSATATVTGPTSGVRNYNATSTVGDPKCWPGIGETNTLVYRADVTASITGNGNYIINLSTTVEETDGLSLLIIYRDYNALYQGSLVLNDGLIVGSQVAGQYVNTQTLTGFNVCANSNLANAFVIVSDFQDNPGWAHTSTLNNITQGFSQNFWNVDVLNTSVFQGQTTSQFGVSSSGAVDDCYAWIVMGLYYQTNCMDCSFGAQEDALELCVGQSTRLHAHGADTYQWTSNPVGFTSTDPNPVVTPNVTTTYTLTGTVGGTCIKTSQITVVVHPLPLVNAISDVPKLCIGASTQLHASGADTYQWTSNPPGFTSTDPNPIVAPSTTTTYTVTGTGAGNCTNTAQVTVQVNPLPVVSIIAKGPTTICSCDSVSLEAVTPEVYPSYVWSNGATGRSIVVHTAGSYTCTVIDVNGCRMTSNAIPVTVIIPTSTVALLPSSTIEAASGQHITVPLVLTAQSNLDFCGMKTYTAVISVNKGVLVPTGSTPHGFITGKRRSITVTGTRTGDTLGLVEYIATLGDTDMTDITIESFVWNECASTIATIPTNFQLSDVCTAGGIKRLYRSPSSTAILWPNAPNPFDESTEIRYSIDKEGFVQLFILDILGQKIATLVAATIAEGTYEVQFDSSHLPAGTYTCVLQTKDQTLTRMMEVRK